MRMELGHYVTPRGRDPFQEWLDSLQDLAGRLAILRRLDRLRGEHFGDCRYCRDGVWELRIAFGPGYRVYYSREGLALLLLLHGGSKRTQARDMDVAVQRWRDYRERSGR